MHKVRVAAASKVYEIEIESGLYGRLPEIFESRYKGKKLALVSDSKVFDLYGGLFLQRLKEKGFEAVPIVFPEGELHKNIDTLSGIYKSLADASFTRSDYVVAIGGGVTGDMAGLAAATFLRGMGFIQIPTSLLAMVDSSIGGKVAVDMLEGKNLIGAFYQPDAVYTDPSLLKTLDDSLFSDGMAELLKHGFIRDKELSNRLTALGGRAGLEPQLDEIVLESCRIKRDVVEQDECDLGLRQILNFGHTIGHAVEKVQQYKGFTHGGAVSAGMVMMTRITEKMGITKIGTSDSISGILKSYGLPVELPDISTNDLVNAVRIDKKTRSGVITISFIREIGVCELKELSLGELEEKIIAELDNRT